MMSTFVPSSQKALAASRRSVIRGMTPPEYDRHMAFVQEAFELSNAQARTRKDRHTARMRAAHPEWVA